MAAAVAQDGRALAFAVEALKNDLGVVLAAVRQDGMALKYADDDLKDCGAVAIWSP